MNILIVDDEMWIRRIYSILLTCEGFNVETAGCVLDANEILKNKDIHVVLLDIKMKEVNGTTLFELIRTFHPNVKVIVTSVYPVSEQTKLIRGAIDYHDKSHGLDTLLEKIKKISRNVAGHN